MATFTWTVTGSGGSNAWETPAACGRTAAGTPGFNAAGTDYFVGSSNPFTITDIGSGGTGTPDIANSLTVSDVQATLLYDDTAPRRSTSPRPST